MVNLGDIAGHYEHRILSSKPTMYDPEKLENVREMDTVGAPT